MTNSNGDPVAHLLITLDERRCVRIRGHTLALQQLRSQIETALREDGDIEDTYSSDAGHAHNVCVTRTGSEHPLRSSAAERTSIVRVLLLVLVGVLFLILFLVGS